MALAEKQEAERKKIVEDELRSKFQPVVDIFNNINLQVKEQHKKLTTVKWDYPFEGVPTSIPESPNSHYFTYSPQGRYRVTSFDVNQISFSENAAYLGAQFIIKERDLYKNYRAIHVVFGLATRNMGIEILGRGGACFGELNQPSRICDFSDGSIKKDNFFAIFDKGGIHHYQRLASERLYADSPFLRKLTHGFKEVALNETSQNEYKSRVLIDFEAQLKDFISCGFENIGMKALKWRDEASFSTNSARASHPKP